MEPLSNILAGADDDLGRIIGIVVLVAFGIIGSLVKKGAKAREEREAQEREAARRRRQAVEAARGQQQPAPVPPPILGKAARRAAAEAAAAAQAAARAVQHPARRETLGEGVDDEMAQFSRRQDQLQASRQSRLHLTEAEAVVVESPANLSVSVPGRQPLRLQGSAVAQAIILREILSPPKALRQEQEMWDL